MRNTQFNSGNVFYFDESTVQQFSTCKYYVRKPPRKRFEERCILQTIKHTASVIILVGMSVNMMTALFFLPPRMTINGKKYMDLLRDKLKLHMAVHKYTIFMHDGALIHGSKIVTQFWKTKTILILD